MLSPLRLPAYAFLVITLLFQIGDFLLVSAPWRFGAVAWRFTAFGTFSNTIGNVILLILILYALALAMGDRKIVLGVGILCAGMAAVVLLGSAAFALDAIQVRKGVAVGSTAGFDVLWRQGMIRALCYGTVLALFAFSAVRAWRTQRKNARQSGRGGEDTGKGRIPLVSTQRSADG